MGRGFTRWRPPYARLKTISREACYETVTRSASAIGATDGDWTPKQACGVRVGVEEGGARRLGPVLARKPVRSQSGSSVAVPE